MKTIIKVNGKDFEMEWESTGEILDVIDGYDHTELVEGFDDNGNRWIASAEISCGEMVEIIDPEMD